MVIKFLLLITFVSAGNATHYVKKAEKMEIRFLQDLARVLINSQATRNDVMPLIDGDVESMPPNQIHINLKGKNGINSVDLVFSEDNDPTAPVKIVIVSQGSSSNLRLKDLQSSFGHWEITGEERRPGATELVTFARKATSGIDLLISARVKRPASEDAQVTSVQFVRTAHNNIP